MMKAKEIQMVNVMGGQITSGHQAEYSNMYQQYPSSEPY